MKINRTIRFESADLPFSLREQVDIKKWLVKTVELYGCSIADLQYVFCSDDFLLDINQRFLQHDEYTDIITFDLSEEKKMIRGEIYISIPRVRENGDIFLSGFRNELHRVMVHGVLHLCGLKDKTKKEAQIMRLAEQSALSERNF